MLLLNEPQPSMPNGPLTPALEGLLMAGEAPVNHGAENSWNEIESGVHSRDLRGGEKLGIYRVRAPSFKVREVWVSVTPTRDVIQQIRGNSNAFRITSSGRGTGPCLHASDAFP
jgi:hypothetical protein